MATSLEVTANAADSLSKFQFLSNILIFFNRSWILKILTGSAPPTTTWPLFAAKSYTSCHTYPPPILIALPFQFVSQDPLEGENTLWNSSPDRKFLSQIERLPYPWDLPTFPPSVTTRHRFQKCTSLPQWNVMSSVLYNQSNIIRLREFNPRRNILTSCSIDAIYWWIS